MGGLRTFLLASLCLVAVGAHPLRAQTLPDPHHVATCTGRLSALMEHQFLFDGPASEETRRRRDALADILDAIAPAGAETRLMALRIEAKAAHAALLSQAAFGRDPGRLAALRASRLIDQCAGFLLS